MTELICIVCPKGCHLKVDETDDYKVSGAGCERGIAYGKKELTNPTRVITSTVRLEGGVVGRLPVKTDRDIPKQKIFDAMKLLNGVTIKSPVKTGDVVIPNILGLNANFVATRTL
jgi:CxxC motif-containing protein